MNAVNISPVLGRVRIKNGDSPLSGEDSIQNPLSLGGISSVGRALRSHRRGHRFESGILHV